MSGRAFAVSALTERLEIIPALGVINLKPRSDCLQRSSRHVLRQVQDKLWQIAFPFPAPTNCWLVQENDGLTLVDAGHTWSSASILSAVQLLDVPLRRIVITHAHPDHFGAAAELAVATGAVVMAHQAEVAYLQGDRNIADEPGYWLTRMVLKTGHRLGLLGVPFVKNVQTVVEGERIGSLVVMHTPGHTPGSISLWDESTKAIFCGDNLLYSVGAVRIGLPWFTLNGIEQSRSLQRYAELPAELLLSGHGSVYRGDLTRELKRLL